MNELNLIKEMMKDSINMNEAISPKMMERYNTLKRNEVKKEALDKSSNLSTCLENWENTMRQQNKFFGSVITRSKLGLIVNVEFFYNAFKTVNKGAQHVKWVYLTLSDVD